MRRRTGTPIAPLSHMWKQDNPHDYLPAPTPPSPLGARRGSTKTRWRRVAYMAQP